MKRLTIAALLLASCSPPSDYALARAPKTQWKICSDGSRVRYTQRCPAPTPTPTPSPTPTPTPTPTPSPPNFPVVSPNGLSGQFDIADNFDTNSWLEAGEAPHESPDEVGAFRFTCLAGQLLKDDPIVYPGLPGVSHLHQFFGNTGTVAGSTYNSLRTTGGSTCTRSTGQTPQRSAYWMPAMLDGAGNAVKPDWINTYYKRYPASDPNCAVTTDPLVPGSCIGFPNGLRFILGYNMKTGTGGPADTNSRDYWAMGFDCNNKTDGGSYTGIRHTMAEIVSSGQCPAGAWLRVYLTFPDCWDGKNLDTADHRSHMAFGAPVHCPASHPYMIPEIAVQAFFTVDDNFFAGKWRLSSDEMMPGVVPGTTLHMDYWEAWSPVVKGLWQTHCINEHLTCSSGSLGNNQQVRGMQQVGPFPNHVLVPLSSIP